MRTRSRESDNVSPTSGRKEQTEQGEMYQRLEITDVPAITFTLLRFQSIDDHGKPTKSTSTNVQKASEPSRKKSSSDINLGSEDIQVFQERQIHEFSEIKAINSIGSRSHRLSQISRNEAADLDRLQSQAVLPQWSPTAVELGAALIPTFFDTFSSLFSSNSLSVVVPTQSRVKRAPEFVSLPYDQPVPRNQ